MSVYVDNFDRINQTCLETSKTFNTNHICRIIRWNREHTKFTHLTLFPFCHKHEHSSQRARSRHGVTNLSIYYVAQEHVVLVCHVKVAQFWPASFDFRIKQYCECVFIDMYTTYNVNPRSPKKNIKTIPRDHPECP